MKLIILFPVMVLIIKMGVKDIDYCCGIDLYENLRFKTFYYCTYATRILSYMLLRSTAFYAFRYASSNLHE